MLELDRIPWGPLRVKDTYKLRINIEKPCEIQSRYGPSTIFNLFSVFKNRLQICKPRIWKSHRFVDPLILGSWQLRKHSEVSQTSVSCSLQISLQYCYLLISVLISLDWYLWMFGKDEEQHETNQVVDHLPRKDYINSINYNKISEKFPLETGENKSRFWGNHNFPKIKTHLSCSFINQSGFRPMAIVQVADLYHSIASLPASVIRWWARQTGEENTPICKGS